jgi:hypothetical protein
MEEIAPQIAHGLDAAPAWGILYAPGDPKTSGG